MLIKEGDIIKHFNTENTYIVLKVLTLNDGVLLQRIKKDNPNIVMTPVAFTTNFIDRNFSLVQLAEMGRFVTA